MSDAEPELVIPPPREDRQPLRANLLNVMQKGASVLTPLFPYLHPGAIVPAGTVFIGGPEADHGHFFHKNSVDEVIVAFVANGATLQTGQTYVGGRSHGVNSFLKNEKQAGSFAFFSITQRQDESGPQTEHMTIMCPKCRKQMYDYEFDTTPPPDAHELEHPFIVHRGSFDAMRAFNDDERLRTCDGCGFVHDLFPNDTWGWERYATQAELAVEARKQLLETAATATATTASTEST